MHVVLHIRAPDPLTEMEGQIPGSGIGDQRYWCIIEKTREPVKRCPTAGKSSRATGIPLIFFKSETHFYRVDPLRNENVIGDLIGVPNRMGRLPERQSALERPQAVDSDSANCLAGCQSQRGIGSDRVERLRATGRTDIFAIVSHPDDVD